MKLALHKKEKPIVTDPVLKSAMDLSCTEFMNYCEKEKLKAKIVMAVSASKLFFIVFTIGERRIHFSLQNARYSHHDIVKTESKILDVNGLPTQNESAQVLPLQGQGGQLSETLTPKPETTSVIPEREPADGC